MQGYYEECQQGGKTQGMKVAFNPKDVDEESGNEGSTGFAKSDIEYRCLPAVVGDDKFSPPEDVSFLDIDQMMNQGEFSEDQIQQLQEVSESQ